MSEAKRQTVRIPNDVKALCEDIVKREKCTLSEALMILAREGGMARKAGVKLTTTTPAKEEDDGDTTPVVTAKSVRRYKYDKFILPIGERINTVDGGRTEPWFCPEHRVSEVTALCQPWVDSGGFTLHWGEPLEEDLYGTNLRFCPSTKMVPGLQGDRLVWLEVDDASKAIDYMNDHTDIPVVVGNVDWLRVSPGVDEYDPLYAQAVDTANDLFMYYFVNGRPKPLHNDPDAYLKALLEEV